MANIISLTVENFRSYKNRTTFTFEAIDAAEMPGNYHVERPEASKPVQILNTAVIYGANAAGKSNVIIALWAFFSFVKHSRTFDAANTIRYEPYLLSEKTMKEPIFMAIRFMAEGVLYDYEFTFNKIAFLSEKLTAIQTDTIIFERGADSIAHYNPNVLTGMMDEPILRNHLILSDLSIKAHPVIQAVYKELTSMNIVLQTEDYPDIEDTTKMAAAMVFAEEPNSHFSYMLRELIKSCDTGISGVSVRKINPEKFYFPESVPESVQRQFIQEHQYVISMVHQTEDGENIAFPMHVESTGTQTLFKAGALAIKALEEGGLLAYDEMNMALHPVLFRRLVWLFNNKETNPNNAQLLITTHDTVLIDDRLLRADQIWFAEKKNGVSELYSAIDFDGVAIDQPFGPWYRAGRMGARPRVAPYPRKKRTTTKSKK